MIQAGFVEVTVNATLEIINDAIRFRAMAPQPPAEVAPSSGQKRYDIRQAIAEVKYRS
jgi:hypothetical protein